MSFLQRWSIGAAIAVVSAVPLSAQQRAPGDGGVASFKSAMSATAPSFRNAMPFALEPTSVSSSVPFPVREGQSRSLATEPAVAARSLPFPPQQSGGRPVTTMIVGGVGLVVGSAIGGDTGTIVMAAGGVVALIGLYRYLR